MDETRPDATPVAQWEFMSVAIMLIGTHGNEAEAFARERLDEALANGHAGERVTWGEVVKLLPAVRLRHRGNS